MAVQFTIQGLLIYAAMAAYLLAFVLRLAGRKRPAWFAFAAGFAVAIAAVVWRGFSAGHAPLQNLFEIFMVLAMLMFPLSVFCRRLLGAGEESADMLLGAVLLFPAGFVFGAQPRLLPPALQSPLFVPHVTSYMIAYVVLIKAAVLAGAGLIFGDAPHEANLSPRSRATHRLVCLGFVPLTFGLVLGAVWGKLAWGDWWNWDPKELASLATWLVYVGYFHVRVLPGRRRLKGALVIVGAVLIVVTLLWVNLSKLFAGLHSYA